MITGMAQELISRPAVHKHVFSLAPPKALAPHKVGASVSGKRLLILIFEGLGYKESSFAGAGAVTPRQSQAVAALVAVLSVSFFRYCCAEFPRTRLGWTLPPLRTGAPFPRLVNRPLRAIITPLLRYRPSKRR